MILYLSTCTPLYFLIKISINKSSLFNCFLLPLLRHTRVRRRGNYWIHFLSRNRIRSRPLLLETRFLQERTRVAGLSRKLHFVVGRRTLRIRLRRESFSLGDNRGACFAKLDCSVRARRLSASDAISPRNEIPEGDECSCRIDRTCSSREFAPFQGNLAKCQGDRSNKTKSRR